MQVLISGAGIAGCTLSYFLAKPGASITIVEKSQTFLGMGQNIDIDGSAITVMKKMKLMDQLRRFNTTEKGTQFIDRHGKTFAPFPVKKGHPSPTSEFEILRGDLANVLFEATKANPNITYYFGTTIDEVLSNDDNSVKVKLSNGKVQEFDLVVAADGQWSKTRKQCFPTEVSVVDKGMYGVYWTAPRLPSDNDWWNIYIALKSRGISLRPDPHGTIRAGFTCMPSNDSEKKAWQDASRSDNKLQVEFLRHEFKDAGWQAPRLLETLDQAPDLYVGAVQQIRMSRWSKSRVVCLGDAAYAPTPLTGMGTSLTIIGSYVLAGELSKLTEGEHPSRALEAYENTLRPFVEKVQKLPSFVPAIVHPGTAWKRWLLQSSISIMSRVVANSWVAWWFGDDDAEKNDNGFHLPEYPGLDGQCPG